MHKNDWLNFNPDIPATHIVPVDDLIEHDCGNINELYRCPCNPQMMPQFNMVAHHSLDARESAGFPPPIIFIQMDDDFDDEPDLGPGDVDE